MHSLAIGVDASCPGAFVQHYDREAEYFGNSGIHRWACGSINVAMWDAWGKTVGQPVWKLFGAYRDRVPLYGSGGWLSYSIPELLDEVGCPVLARVVFAHRSESPSHKHLPQKALKARDITAWAEGLGKRREYHQDGRQPGAEDAT